MHHFFQGAHLSARQTASQAVIVPWYASTEYADLAAVADFKNWRFAVTEVLVGSVPGATAAALKVKREATFAEFFAFTATSTTARTYINSSGTLVNDLAANAPRRDYRNGKQQFRLEDARTNLCIRSEEQDNAAWTKTNLTVTANSVAAPNGATIADTIDDGVAVTVTHSTASTAISFTNATTYTYSHYVKQGTGRYIQLAFGSAAFGLNAYANYDLQTGATGTVGSAATATITGVGNGWYRLTVTAPATSTTSTTLAVFVITSSTSVRGESFTGTNRTYYLWGAQAEAGAFASDYIPTTTAAVTRAIETARLSPLLEAILQRTAASVIVRGDLTNTLTSATGVMMGAATTEYLIGARKSVSTTNVGAFDGTLTVSTTLGSGVNTDPMGLALGFDGSGRSFAGNGGAVGTDASVATTNTTVYLARTATNTAGTYGDGLYDFVGIAPERLSNAALQALAVPA